MFIVIIGICFVSIGLVTKYRGILILLVFELTVSVGIFIVTIWDI